MPWQGWHGPPCSGLTCSGIRPWHLFPRLIRLQWQQPSFYSWRSPSSFSPQDLGTSYSIHPELSSCRSIAPAHHQFEKRSLIFRSQLKCHISQESHSDYSSQSSHPTYLQSLIILFYVLLCIFPCLNLSSWFLYVVCLIHILNYKFMRTSAYLIDSHAFPETWETQCLHIIGTQYLWNKWMDG